MRHIQLIGFREDLKTNSERMCYDDVERMFEKTHTKLLHTKGYCHKCDDYCELVQTNIHVAGTPCIAWSSMGLRCGASGPSLLCFMTWAYQRLQQQEDAILHENTPEFNHMLLDKILGRYYSVQSCIVNATTFGTPCERPRRLTWLLHKRMHVDRVPGEVSWSEDWTSLFFRTIEMHWRAYFELASKDEIMQELRWAANREESVGHGRDLFHGMSFEGAFIDQERCFLLGYLRLPNGWSSVVSLMQDPVERCSYNRGKSVSGTLIKANFPQYSPEHRRWLCPRETISTNTMVAYKFLSVHGEMSSLCFDREAHGFPARKRHIMFEQAGDSMNVPSIGIALAWYHSRKLRCFVAASDHTT